jgi:hypothetical protein
MHWMIVPVRPSMRACTLSRRPPSQGWRTFVHNHADAIASIDMFVVPAISFGLLYGLLILRQSRREIPSWQWYPRDSRAFRFFDLTGAWPYRAGWARSPHSDGRRSCGAAGAAVRAVAVIMVQDLIRDALALLPVQNSLLVSSLGRHRDGVLLSHQYLAGQFRLQSEASH